MKKNVSLLALSTLFGVTAAFAAPQDVSAPAPQNQTAPAPQNHRRGQFSDPNQQVQRLAKRLQLTSEQQNQLLPIFTQHQEQAKSIRSDSSLSAADRQAKLKDLRQQNNDQIRGVLTDAQKQQYDEMLQHARSRAHAKRHQANSTPAAL